MCVCLSFFRSFSLSAPPPSSLLIRCPSTLSLRAHRATTGVVVVVVVAAAAAVYVVYVVWDIQ